MVRAEDVRCPHCGGSVDVDADEQWIICRYCQQRSRLQMDRSAPQQSEREPPPVAAMEPVAPPATPQTDPAAHGVGVAIGLGALLVIAILIAVAVQHDDDHDDPENRPPCHIITDPPGAEVVVLAHSVIGEQMGRDMEAAMLDAGVSAEVADVMRTSGDFEQYLGRTPLTISGQQWLIIGVTSHPRGYELRKKGYRTRSFTGCSEQPTKLEPLPLTR